MLQKPTPKKTAKSAKSAIAQADIELLSELRAAELAEHNHYAGWSLLAIAATLIIFCAWAAFAKLDEVTLGQGQVVSSSSEQIIQTMDGGMLEEMYVKEGSVVEKDQPLLRIDDTRLGASFREGQSKVDALKAAAARLRAEANGQSPEFGKDLRERRPEIVELETRSYQSRIGALNETTAAKQRSVALAEDELRITAPLAEKGVVSEIDVLRLRRQIAEFKGQIQDQRNKFRADAAAELSRIEAELSVQGEVVTGRADQVKHAILRAPLRGVVKNIRVKTVGGVMRPGEEIMQIVPSEDRLLIEAKIRPSDVAFLRPGQRAAVKITAYDYSIYGGLEGVLEQISPDTVRDDVRKDETFYIVRVRTNEGSSLRGPKGEALPIMPGMIATVEVLTGHKTVMDYLLKPILKARETMRER